MGNWAKRVWSKGRAVKAFPKGGVTCVLAASLAAAVVIHPIFAETLAWRLPTRAAVQPELAQAAAPPQRGWTLPSPSKAVTIAARPALHLPADRAMQPLFGGASVVVTGFSGQTTARPVLPAGQLAAARSNPDYATIDLNGAVATITDIAHYGAVMDGREVTRPARDQLYAREIGQVFGAVLDDDPAPNLYLAASSAFGLHIVKPDSNGDAIPDRITKGEAGAQWMAGQWGFAPQSGAGTIWRVDGATGQVAVFANLAQEGAANAAPGLGNLAFDAPHNALLVSDLATGIVTRLDADGGIIDSFDHGTGARGAAGLDPVPFDAGGRVQITDAGFDSLNPDTWGFAPPERRVWGLAVQGGRLYYSVAAGKAARPEVWSVGLDTKTGAFLPDPRWELTLADIAPPFEISDIGFDDQGRMTLAQRGPRKPAYDFSQHVDMGKAAVLRYGLEAPIDDPATPSVWSGAPQIYAVGFAGDQTNGAGGLAFGPSYDAQGKLDFSQCTGTLWTTGEALRTNDALKKQLAKGGHLRVNGVQAQPTALPADKNTPPWFSYAHDFDGKYGDAPRIGYLGDVVVLGCQTGAGGGGASLVSNNAANTDAPPEGPPLCNGALCSATLCILDPDLCAPPSENICAQVTATLRCDEKGGYVADISYGNAPASLSQIKLTDPSGQITSLPQSIATAASFAVPLTGLGAGQVGQINLCSFDAATAANGAPHDCCNTAVAFKIPTQDCKPQVQP